MFILLNKGVDHILAKLIVFFVLLLAPFNISSSHHFSCSQKSYLGGAVVCPIPPRTPPKPSYGPWASAVVSEYGDGDGFMYAHTASGATVTPTSLGVANLSLPFGTKIEFCLSRCVVAVVDDRGPYVAGRLFDLQPAVASAIGFPGLGVVKYRIGTS